MATFRWFVVVVAETAGRGAPYCHVHQSALDIADVHEHAADSGPMVALEAWQEGRCALCGGEVPLR
jgi:hypothetical protein